MGTKPWHAPDQQGGKRRARDRTNGVAQITTTSSINVEPIKGNVPEASVAWGNTTYERYATVT